MHSTMQDEQLSLATLLEYGTGWHGDATVSTWTDAGTRRITFAELGREAARLANGLRSLGIKPGDRVGTFSWNNIEHMTAYAAIPAMGAVLHTVNIRLFAEQVAFIADHAADRVMLVDGSLLSQLSAALPGIRTLRHVVVVNGDASALEAPIGVEVHDYRELLDAQSDSYPWPDIDERAAAAICYTSGTTGDPKGVVYSHRSIWLHSQQVTASYGMDVSPEDTVLPIVPMFHAMSWGIPYGALMAGSSVVMPDRFLQPNHLVRLLAEERPTFAAAVPAVWIGVLQQLDAHPQDITHLRHVVVGGSAVPPSLSRAFSERHGVEIVQAWGMTEISPLASLAWAPRDTSGDEAWNYRYTQGRFLPGIRARLVDDEGRLVPPDGESLGEVEIRSPWTTASYYSPGSTPVGDDKFDDGWLRTGDIGKVTPNGYLTLVDRSKDVIKSGGEWISSVDLENEVMAHPDVLEAAAIGIPDEKWDERPLLAVVLREGATVTPDQLRGHLAAKFAKWQLPERWSFISEVPKTSVGKFDKKVLRARYADGELDVVASVRGD
ncbi:fatty acid--CoA ligase [Tsukamurella sp. 8F]|uniref:fatty acid--CoA ligase n=1 Tax=unclassified Tsukamurella TaxID=2633480 RepID=UPI0023B8D18C|nr:MULTISPECIES: fatty acid--CoA ligase [unclassified Tsukamurella]MDF0531033.1 fatty acid--CoA ligase [Tsukamurella sp. 8J]MDF0585500.1 fatty acid--CoA ligase [Tsukamurella sp. 8F]